MRKLAENIGNTIIGQVCINPFEVKGGDIIAVNWPLILDSTEEEQFCKALKKEIKFPNLISYEKVEFANSTSKRLLRMRNKNIPGRPSFLNTLPRGIQKRFNDELKFPINHLPGTFRTLVALHLSCTISTLIIFNTSGLDPMGELTVLNYCAKKAQDGWAFIYLRHPLVSNTDRLEEPLTNTPLIATVSRGRVNPDSKDWEWVNIEVES